jgi:hypothetical protein
MLPKSGHGSVVTKLEVSEGEFFDSLLCDHFMLMCLLMCLFLICALLIRTITLVYRRLGTYHLRGSHHRQEDFSRTTIRTQWPRAATPTLESVYQHQKIPPLVFLGFHRGGPFDATSTSWDGKPSGVVYVRHISFLHSISYASGVFFGRAVELSGYIDYARGFIKCASIDAAEEVLQKLNGMLLPGGGTFQLTLANRRRPVGRSRGGLLTGKKYLRPEDYLKRRAMTEANFAASERKRKMNEAKESKKPEMASPVPNDPSLPRNNWNSI